MGEAQGSKDAQAAGMLSRVPVLPRRKPDQMPDLVPSWRLRLERQIGLTRAALGFERLWPRLWWPLGLVLVFLAVSWLGLWLDLPPLWRMAGVGLFGLGLVASLIPFAGWRWPARADAIDRLDSSAPGAHRPAASVDDVLALGGTDPVAQALWRLHQDKQAAAVSRLRAGKPRPLMAGRDPRALRLVPVLAAVAALFVAGPDMQGRLAAAFQWSPPPVPPPQARIDAWIDPPAYTRLAPILIDLAAIQRQGSAGATLRAPQNSTVVVRLAGPPAVLANAQVEPRGGMKGEDPVKSAEPAANTPAQPAQAGGVRESRFRLTGDAGLLITQGLSAGKAASGKGNILDLRITAIPDRAPEINFVEAPKANDRGGLGVTYRASDDYGLGQVEALFERQGNATATKPLIDPPRVALALPGIPTGEEETKSVLELAEHPWAGAKVRMTLLARDEAGQEGQSQPQEVTLPQRTFTNPLAKALVEERRRLILDTGARRRVQAALDALLIAPDVYMPEKGNYLGLKMIASQLRRARLNPQLVEVTEQLWALALHLEDGGLSDAERDLRAAQERLQQALERNAGEDEIRKLTDEMRRAMDRFMRDFAQRMEREMREKGQDNQMSRLPENFRTVTPRDLKGMLDRIEELARRGETAEAQRLLEELRNMMQNLQMARPGQRDPQGQQRNEAMNELDKMMRDQQALRDDTFREGEQRRNGQQARPPRRPGDQQARPQNRPGERQQPGQRGQQPGGEQPGDDGDDEAGEGQQQGQQGGQQGQSLRERQQALRDRLQQLQRRMQGLGMPGQEGFGEAEDAMGEAEQALGQNPGQGQGQGQGGGEGQATDAQGRALDALRRGSQNLAQQMQQPGDGDGDGDGTENALGGDPNNPTGRSRADSRGQERDNNDPLGRPKRQRDWAQGNVRVPGADESATQRARRVLEELRRRLGDAGRPQDELDYLERLLRRN